MEKADVVIVGARCAGSAAAAHLARAGRRVIVLDTARFPSDTLSSHTVFTPVLEELERMGALDDMLTLDPPQLLSMCIEIGGSGHTRTVYRERSRTDRMWGMSVPRILFDKVIVDAARRSGADIREGATVTDLQWRAGRAAGVVYVDHSGRRGVIAASLVLAADGVYSTVATLVGSTVPYRYSHTGRGAVYRYLDDPATSEPDASTVYFWRNGPSQGFGFPTTPRGKILVMFLADRREIQLARRDPAGYWHQKLEEHPGARDRLAGATGATPLRITDALTSFFRASSGPGWALIGDAGHFKDPVIGQGMRDALWAGRTAAEHAADVLDDPVALDRALRRWEAERDRECKAAYLMAVYESRSEEIPFGLAEVAGVLGELDLNLTPAIAGRDGTLREELSARTLARAVTRAVWRSDQPMRCVRDLAAEAVLGMRLSRASRRTAFRDNASVIGFESSEPGWPRPPLQTTTQSPCPTRVLEGQFAG